MLRSYSDFINHNPRYRKLENDTYFQAIFNFFSQKMNIIKMLDTCNWNKPALSGCVTPFESKFSDLLNQPFNDYFIRQAIGAMIKEILAPFGYVPFVQKGLPKDKQGLFKSAHSYTLDKGKIELELIQTWEIVPVKKDPNY